MAGAKGAVYSHSVGKRFNVARWATCRPNRRDFGGREQEKSLTRFQTSVSYAKLPTTFVGGVSYGKSRFKYDQAPVLVANSNQSDFPSVRKMVKGTLRSTIE